MSLPRSSSRQTPWIALLGALAAATCAACSGDDDAPSDPEDAGMEATVGPPSEETFCDAFAAEVCAAEARCCAMPRTEAECTTFERDGCLDARARFADDGLVYDATKSDELLAYMRHQTMRCGGEIDAFDQLVLYPYSGAGVAGASCFAPEMPDETLALLSCAPGIVCAFRSVGLAATCVAPVPAGGACITSTVCPLLHRCGPDAEGAITCQPLSDDGAPCVRGDECIGGACTDDGTCATRPFTCRDGSDAMPPP